MKNLKLLLLTLVSLWGLGACEKMVLAGDAADSAEGNVTIRATMFSIVPFDDTRAVQPIADYCSRLCFVLYQDGEQKRKVLQKSGDSNYGQIAVRLNPGTYQLLVLGHSSDGNPTLASPESIKFTNTTGYSDTFYYYGNLVVGEEGSSHDVALQRATSMLRVIITDEIPGNVSRIRLYYTGESGVFDAVAGWGGSTNSKQHTFYDVAGRQSPLALEAYTFLRNETGTLNVTLTAYDSDDTVIAEKELSDVPMRNCMVTEFSGPLFSVSTSDTGFNFTADTAWEVYGQFTF